jgi:hypothetical protein
MAGDADVEPETGIPGGAGGEPAAGGGHRGFADAGLHQLDPVAGEMGEGPGFGPRRQAVFLP